MPANQPHARDLPQNMFTNAARFEDDLRVSENRGAAVKSHKINFLT